MPKSRSQMTPQEAQNYLDSYFATVDTLNSSLTKYQTLAASAATPEQKSKYNAEALLAMRELELLTNKRRAFQANTAIVNPPDGPTVERTRQISAAVAQIQATDANFNAIVAGMTSALTEFNKIHA